jgi:excisionase family DNA binding protein
MNRYLTTGQIAQELKVTNQTVRNYCDSGIISATKSAGGHYRIEPAELERLKGLDKLPPLARATISGNGVRPQTKKNPNELLAQPSIDAIDSAEDAYRSERELATDTHQLARMKVRKEGVELQDWFENRNQKRVEKALEEERRQAEEYDKQMRQRQAQAAAQQRREFEKKWLSYALNNKPRGAPDDYSLLVKPEVMDALAEINTDEDYYIVEPLVMAAISRALEPWRKQEARRRAVKYAVESLPISMRGWCHDSEWATQGRITASNAVASANENASADDLNGIAKEAVKPLTKKWEHTERIESAVKHLIVSGGTAEETEEAREAAREALSALPADVSRRVFDATKERALAPIQERIALRMMKASIDSWVPTGFSEAEKGVAFNEATKALSALPSTASNDEKQAVAHAAIDRQATKKRLITEALQEVPGYARRLMEEFEYSDAETSQGIEQRVRRKVEKALSDELNGTENRHNVIRLVHKIMRDLEGCA